GSGGKERLPTLDVSGLEREPTPHDGGFSRSRGHRMMLEEVGDRSPRFGVLPVASQSYAEPIARIFDDCAVGLDGDRALERRDRRGELAALERPPPLAERDLAR